jgi:hypothetical protein
MREYRFCTHEKCRKTTPHQVEGNARTCLLCGSVKEVKGHRGARLPIKLDGATCVERFGTE